MWRILLSIMFLVLIPKGMIWSDSHTLPDQFEKKINELNIPRSSDVIVIHISNQKMIYFKDGKGLFAFDISTAINGPGQRERSNQTPLGLHRISNKIGGGAAIDTIFKGRVNTGRAWNRSDPDQNEGDLILSRILWLEGLEHGHNKGRDAKGALVDSKKRYIYIHGTNQEDLLGSPASLGCVRMSNASVIGLFNKVPVGTLVWIQV